MVFLRMNSEGLLHVHRGKLLQESLIGSYKDLESIISDDESALLVHHSSPIRLADRESD